MPSKKLGLTAEDMETTEVFKEMKGLNTCFRKRTLVSLKENQGRALREAPER